jgi:Glycosyltransferase family 87
MTWGRPADVALYGFSALFAAYTWNFSELPPHRAWAEIAVWGYLAAAIAVTMLRTQLARAVLTAATWGATALLPLIYQATERATGRIGRAQEEVVVIEAAGVRMLRSGTPYLDRDAIAAVPAAMRLTDYLPYQPGMAIVGLPRALAGIVWWTDARVMMALLSTLALALALLTLDFRSRFVGRSQAPLRALQAVTVLPLAALAVTTGGDDVPVLALSLLACALCVRSRWTLAGLAIGCAAALKLTAWPVALVLGLVVFARARRSLPGRDPGSGASDQPAGGRGERHPLPARPRPGQQSGHVAAARLPAHRPPARWPPARDRTADLGGRRCHRLHPAPTALDRRRGCTGERSRPASGHPADARDTVRLPALPRGAARLGSATAPC